MTSKRTKNHEVGIPSVALARQVIRDARPGSATSDDHLKLPYLRIVTRWKKRKHSDVENDPVVENRGSARQETSPSHPPQTPKKQLNLTNIRISTWAIRSRTEQGNDKHRRANAMQIEQSQWGNANDRPLDPRLEDGREDKNRYLM